MKRSRLDSNALSRLKQKGLIVPVKLPDSTVVYQESQVLELCLIYQLKQIYIQWTTIRRVLESYRDRNWVAAKYILITDEDVFWLGSSKDVGDRIINSLPDRLSLSVHVIDLEGTEYAQTVANQGT